MARIGAKSRRSAAARQAASLTTPWTGRQSNCQPASAATRFQELVTVDAARSVLFTVGTSGRVDVQTLHLAAVLGPREGEATGALSRSNRALDGVRHAHSPIHRPDINLPVTAVIGKVLGRLSEDVGPTL